MLSIIDKFSKYWTGQVEKGSIRNMNLLLWGPPGSGKTEFAEYISRRLNRRLIIKKASDLLDCYVGNTEKLIRQVFRESEKDNAVLFMK